MRGATILIAAALSLSGCIAHRLSVAPSGCATPQSCARLLYEHAREFNSARLTEDDQQLVADQLRSFGSDGVDELSNLLGWWQPGAVQEIAACALARIGPEASPAIPALIRAVDEKLGCSAEALGSTRDPIAIEHLRAMLAGRRCLGAVGLGFAGPAGAEALATYLENASEHPCLEAVSDALRELGEDAAPVAERLEQIARDEEADDAVREVATEVLADEATGTRAALDPSALVAQMKSPDRRSRLDALRRLARLGPSAAAAAQDLVDALESGSIDERVLAAFALGWIGDEDAVSALANAISPEYWEVSLEAVRALAHYRTPEAVEAIRTASAHWFWLVRDAAADALRASAPPPYSAEAVEASDRQREALLMSSLCSTPPREAVRGGKKLALDAGRTGTDKASDGRLTTLEGGSISFAGDEARSDLLREGALGLVEAGDQLYAITGSLRAGVLGVERDGSRWTVRHFVQLPGYPTGWVADGDGALVLGTTRGMAVLMPDGTLTSEPCPPPASPK